MSSDVIERGLNALLNGAVSFGAALVLGALLWALYSGARLVRLDWVFARLFGGLDWALRKGVARATGAPFKSRWKRWSTFVLFFAVLAGIGAFALTPIALAAVVIALIAVLSIYRLWERDEDKRLERNAKGKTTQDRQDLRDEMLISIALLLFFVPLGYYRLEELVPVTNGNSAFPNFDAALFVWGELIKALPLFDWSEVLRVRTLSGVESTGSVGLGLNLALRITFDLLVLAGILRVFAILRNQVDGLDLRDQEKALWSKNEKRVQVALNSIVDAARNGQKHAIAHLLDTVNSARAEPLLNSNTARIIAGKGLILSARALRKNAEALLDLDDRLLGIEILRTVALRFDGIDQNIWADAKHYYAVGIEDLSRLSLDSQRLSEADAAYAAALTVSTKQRRPTQWADIRYSIGKGLLARASSRSDAGQIRLAIDALNDALSIRTSSADSSAFADAQLSLGNAYVRLAELDDDQEAYDSARKAYEAVLTVDTKRAAPQSWAEVQINLAHLCTRYPAHKTKLERQKSAIPIYEAALRVLSKSRRKGSWGLAHNNYANALGSVGAVEGRTDLLRRSLKSLRISLEVRSKKADPMSWATSHYNMGNTLEDLGDSLKKARYHRQAISSFERALEVFDESVTPYEWGTAYRAKANAQAKLGSLTNSDSLMRAAVESARASMSVFEEHDHPTAWRSGMKTLGSLLGQYAIKIRDEEGVAEAKQILRTLRDSLNPESNQEEWQGRTIDLAAASADLARLQKNLTEFDYAIQLYREVLNELSSDAPGRRWAIAQNGLSRAFEDLWRLTGDEKFRTEAIKALTTLRDWYQSRGEIRNTVRAQRGINTLGVGSAN